MFKRKSSTSALTYIAKGTKLMGESSFSGDALIAGELNGTILSEGMITIDNDGYIEGETQCHEIKISGHYKGKLYCEKLIITGTGFVEGEVTSTQMEIFEGGQFIGVRNKVQLAEVEVNSKLIHQSQDALPHSDTNDKKIAH